MPIVSNQDQSRINKWNIFDDWSIGRETTEFKISWKAFDTLVAHYEKIIERKYEILLPLLKSWDDLLNDFGKDPTHYNWANFRPLRLSREEDWSDWLAHLFASSNTGIFAQCLLKNPRIDIFEYALPKEVYREISHEGFRADLIINWRKKQFSHIEVKIGDTNLLKTYKTSEALREKYRVSVENWENYILLLPPQLVSWEQIPVPNDVNEEIIALPWSDVCIAIRRALLNKETITWKVWAYSFLGAIEQLLIGFPGYLLDKKKPSENLDEKISILRRGLEYGK